MLTEYTTPGASVEVRDDESIYSLLTERIKRTGEDTVIAERKTAPGQWTKVTTGEFHKNVLSAAKGLIAFGIGKGHLPVMFAALANEGHIRVGMEDNVMYSKGVLAQSNRQFVERAARIIREYGNEVATPADAREILGLKK